MAFFTDTHNGRTGMIERATSALSHWATEMKGALARGRIARQTYTELSQLSERELDDLGLTRSDLRRVAREAAHGTL